MSVKKAKKAPKVSKTLTLIDKLPKNRGEWLQFVIKMTEKHDTEDMRAQAIRLKKELAAWKKDNR